MYRNIPPLSSSFLKQAPPSTDDLAAQFIRTTGSTQEQALHYLRITDNNLEKAVPLFLNGEGRQHRGVAPVTVQLRPGGWKCGCGFHNFRKNHSCVRCHARRSIAANPSRPGANPPSAAQPAQTSSKTATQPPPAPKPINKAWKGELAAQFTSITGVPAKFASQYLRVFNDNIDEAIQSFFDNGGNPDGEIPDRYRAQSSAQQSVRPQYFYDNEGVLHGKSEEEEDRSNEPRGVPLISAPPRSGVLYQKLYPIIRGPFSYGLVYSPAQDDFVTALFVPMRRDDIGPHAYEDIARDAVLNIRAMLNAEIKYPRHWEGHPLFDPSIWYLRAQLSHYGLKREDGKEECREALRAAAKKDLLRVPREILELEYSLRKQWEESKVRQKHKLKRVRQWNDEIVMGKLQEAELVGLQEDDLRMWETVEGREQYRKDAMRGRELEGVLKEKMESGEYPKWQVKLWMEEYPKLRERVRHMENVVRAMNLGTFKESREYEIYTGVYEAVERQSAKEHLESLKQRDGLYAWANDDENDKMENGIGPKAFLQELRDEQKKESQGGEIKRPLTFSRGNLGDGNDGFYAKTIRRERHEAAQRETERDERDNWEMGNPHDYRTAEEKLEDEKIDGRLRELIAPSSNQEEDPWGIASLRGSRGVQARSQYTDVASYSRNTAGATSNQYEGGWGVEIPHEYRAAQERTVAEGVQYRPSRQDPVLDGWVPRGAASSSGTARGSSGRRWLVPKNTNKANKAREGSDDGNLFRWGLSDTMQEMLAAQQSSFKK